MTITKKSVVVPIYHLIVHTQSVLTFRLFASERRVALIIFALCLTLRAVPELMAYPYPIGYDVVNYYIPTLANIGERWSSFASQFPLYVLLLDFVMLLTGFSAQSVVVGVSIAMAGFFGISLFYIGRTILKLGIAQSAFLALFVVIQVSTLRTMWDLHKDIFALTTMMIVLSLIARKDTTFRTLVLTIALATLTVSMDKMIGILFCVSLATYAIMTRRKRVIQITALSTALFFLLMLISYETSQITSAVSNNSIPDGTSYEFYNPTNLTILFVVLSGLIAAPAAIGFFAMKNNLLKIPLIVSLLGSLSWLLLPHESSLAADRWIILASIFLSVFAGYGILHLVKNLGLRSTAIVTGSIVGAFAVIGIAYSVLPYDSPFILYGAASSNTGKFMPPTMQFNSLDIKDNHNLVSTIDWLNENTEQDAIIVGEKHWRGFMDMYLKDTRSYKSSDYPSRTAESLSEHGMHVYLISVVDGLQTNFDIKVMSKG
jgi:hypothetical protein